MEKNKNQRLKANLKKIIFTLTISIFGFLLVFSGVSAANLNDYFSSLDNPGKIFSKVKDFFPENTADISAEFLENTPNTDSFVSLEKNILKPKYESRYLLAQVSEFFRPTINLLSEAAKETVRIFSGLTGTPRAPIFSDSQIPEVKVDTGGIVVSILDIWNQASDIFNRNFIGPIKRVLFVPQSSAPILTDAQKEALRTLFTSSELAELNKKISANQIDEETLNILVKRISEKLPEVQQVIREIQTVRQTETKETQFVLNDQKLIELKNLLTQLQQKQESDRSALFNAIALTNKIDNITNITITNPTFAKNSIIDSDIPDTITASNYLPLSGGLLSGALNASSTLQVTGDARIYGALTVDGVTSLGGISLSNPTFTGDTTIQQDLYVNGGDINLGNGSATTTITSAGGNLGIGTTSPSQRLSVQGGALFSGNLSAANINATGTFTTSGLFTFGNASGTQLTTAGSTYLATTGGNVGIGSTTPGAKLSVSGTSLFDGLATFYNALFGNITATGTVTANLLSVTGTSGTSTIAAGQGFIVGGNQFAVQQGNGRVGIGTSTPQAGLHMVGRQDDNALFILETYGADSGLTNAIAGFSAGGTASSPIATAANQDLLFIGGRGYQTDTGAFGAGSKAAIRLRSSEAWTSTAQGTHIRFETTANGGITRTEKMRLTDAGNVGIGSTTPGAKLSVSGTSLFDGLATFYNALFGNITATGTLNVSGLTTLTNASTTQISSTGGAYLATTGGNVGIGTTTPGAKLSVIGITESSTAVQSAIFASLSNGTLNGNSLTIQSNTGGLNQMGGNININSGGGAGSGGSSPGGTIAIQAGASGSSAGTDTGGQVTINGGSGNGSGGGTGIGGAVTVQGGLGNNGGNARVGGTLNLLGGNLSQGTGSHTGGNVVITGGTSGAANTIGGSLNLTGGAGGASEAGGNVTINAGSGGTTGAVRFLVGNVGIGTTSPSKLFSVHGDSLFSGNISAANITATGTFTTSGLFTFGNASGTQLTSTGSTYLATTGGNVGIGTTTPGHKLHIVTSGTVRHSAWDNSTGETVIGFLNAPSFPYGFNLNIGGSARITSASGQSKFEMHSSNNNISVIRLQSSQGPSTARTASLLNDVVGEIGGRGYGATAAPSENTAFMKIITEENWSDSAQGTQLSFSTTPIGSVTPVRRVVFSANGNVGIGTTSPSKLLSVHGDSLFSGNISAANITATGTFTTSGLFTFGNASGTQLTTTGSTYLATSGGQIFVGTTTQPNYADTMAIVNSANATEDGSGGAALGLYSTFSDATVGRGGILALGGKTQGFANPVMSFATIAGFRESATPTNNSGYLALSTTPNGGLPVERMRINSAGNVGIGNTVPTFLLHVGNGTQAGAVQITADAAAGQQAAFVYAKNGTAKWTTYVPASSNDLLFFDGTDNRVAFKNGGSVGIGTTTPTAKLSVLGLGGRSFDWGDTNIPLGALTFVSDNPTIQALSGRDLIFRMTSAERMRITDAGNVGIGTTSPSANLVVNGTTGQNLFQIATSTNQGILTVNANGMVALGTIPPNYYGRLSVNVGPNQNFVFRSNVPTATARIEAVNDAVSANIPMELIATQFSLFGGNVGIGSTTPGAKLSVSGTSLFDGLATFYNALFGNVTATGTLNVSGLATLGNASTTQIGSTGSTYLATSGGNVGIGTTSPSIEVVHIASSGSLSGIRFTQTGLGGGDFALNSETSALGGGFSITNRALGQRKFAIDKNGAFLLGAVGNSGPFNNAFEIISTSTSASLLSVDSITGSGKVGIGSTTPGAKLSVSGTSLFDGLATFYNALFGNITATGTLSLTGTTGTSTIASGQGFTVGSSQFVVQQGSGRVGIGTATPAQSLHVYGSDSQYGLLESTTGHAGLLLKSSSGVTNLIKTDSTTGKLMFEVPNGTVAMTVDDANGNVGIGTTTPAATLSVRSEGNTSIYVDADDGAYATLGISKAGASQWYFTKAASRTDLSLYNASSQEKLTVTQNGNIGIGTTIPRGKLDVNGDLYLATTTSIQFADIYNNGSITYKNGLTTVASLSASGGFSSSVGFRAEGTNGTVNAPSYGFSDQGGIGIYKPSSNKLSFVTASTDRLIIDSSGNVGIGTTTPGYLLDVNGANTAVRVGANSDNYSAYRLRSSLGEGIFGIENSAGGNMFTASLPYATFISAQSNKDFQIATNNTAKLTIAGITGNVGIGTTSPSQVLAVQGNALISGTTTAANITATGTLSFGTDSIATRLSNLQLDFGDGTGYVYRIKNRTATPLNILNIRDNGLITIGNTSSAPGSKLNIISDGDTPFQISSTAGGTQGDWVTVNTSGNVGIGTTGPGSNLHVVGSTVVTSSVIRADSGDDSSNMWKGAFELRHKTDTTISTGSTIGITFTPLSSTGSSFYGSAAIKGVRENATASNQDTALSFWTRAGASNNTTDTEKMRITSGGNVGIGTTSPYTKFAVADGAGTLAFQNVGQNNLYLSGTNASMIIDSTSSSYPALFIRKGGVPMGGISASDVTGIKLENASGQGITVLGSTGNVGIGTTNPNAKLDVLGTASSTNVFVAGGANGGNVPTINGMTIGAGDKNLTFLGDNTGSGTYGRIRAYNTVYNSVGSEIVFNKPLANLGDISFNTNNGISLTERMRILNTGEVGIGTAGPNALTHIYAGASTVGTPILGTNLNIESNSSNYLSLLGPEASIQGLVVGIPGQNTDTWIRRRGDQTNNPLEFGVGASARMVILDNGNVGIGTTTPTGALTVSNGNFEFTNIAANADIQMQFKRYDGSNDPAMYMTYWGQGDRNTLGLTNGGGSGLHVNTSGNVRVSDFTASNMTGTAAFAVTSGNVGIGTVTPVPLGGAAGKLFVVGSGDTSILVQGGTGGAIEAGLRSILTQGQVGTYTNNDFSIVQNGNPHITVKPSGNVGIGTTTPNAPLTVFGTAGPALTVYANNNPQTGATLDFSGANNDGNLTILSNRGAAGSSSYLKLAPFTNSKSVIFLVDESDSQKFKIRTAGNQTTTSSAGTDVLTITQGGNVGIGTTSPTEQLSVANRLYVGGTGTSTIENNLHVRGTLQIGTGSIYIDTNAVRASNGSFVLDSVSTSTLSHLALTGRVTMTGLSTDSLTIGIPGVICLDSNNEIRKLAGVATCIVSSRDYKENIMNLSNGLEWVRELRPVTFDYKENGKPSLGFIAEEVDQVSPLLSVRNEAGKVYSVRYELIPAVLTKAVQELDAKILSLEGMVSGMNISGSVNVVKAWLESMQVFIENGLVRLKELVADKVTTKELCVEDVCVTKDQLKALLQNANIQSSGQSSQPSSSEPTPELEPELILEPAPETSESVSGDTALSETTTVQ